MKTLKFKLQQLAYCTMLLFFIGTITSCGTQSDRNSEEHSEEAGHQHDDSLSAQREDEEGHHHDDGTADAEETLMWMPGDQPFTGILKLAQGDQAKLSPSVTTEEDGSKVLNLNLTGDKFILLFDGAFENVGANLQFKTENFQGDIALVHHYKDTSNYDYVSLLNGSMQLGRVENGNNKVLDKKNKQIPADWTTLTVSSAGEHYKGLLNDELVNHAHGEARAAGQVGVILNGKGKVMLKMMEVVSLEE